MQLPTGIFAHVHGASFEVGKALVTHPHDKGGWIYRFLYWRKTII